MNQTKQTFIQLALARQALKFGEFTLKSGRTSPYFFNAGQFNRGSDLAILGKCYADTLMEKKAEFDLLFGPAYKGIPLATAAACALHHYYQKDYDFCFNRKEAKDHGEGGTLVGAPLKGKVMIVDDVITAGTAIRESIDIIHQAGAVPAGVIVAVDRQERGKGSLSAIQEVEQEYALPVYAIINLNDLLGYVKQEQSLQQHVSAMEQYQAQYGV